MKTQGGMDHPDGYGRGGGGGGGWVSTACGGSGCAFFPRGAWNQNPEF